MAKSKKQKRLEAEKRRIIYEALSKAEKRLKIKNQPGNSEKQRKRLDL